MNTAYWQALDKIDWNNVKSPYVKLPKYKMPLTSRQRRIGRNFLKKRRARFATQRTGGYTRQTGLYKFSTGVERKFYDTTSTTLQTNQTRGVYPLQQGWTIMNTATGALQSGLPGFGLLGIAQTTDASGRIGRKITITRIQLKWEIEQNPLIDGAHPIPIASDAVRIVIILDKQCNGTTPLATDIFRGNTGGGEPTYSGGEFLQFNNLSNSERFTIIYDKVITNSPTAALGTTTAAAIVATHKTGKFYKKCSIPIEYGGIGGFITEIRSNNLILAVASSWGSSSSKFGFHWRVRYTDM